MSDQKTNYKEDCIEKSLEWIKEHFRDLLEFTEDNDEKILFLKDKIKQLYQSFDAQGDVTDACYRVINRRIEEALDSKPVVELGDVVEDINQIFSHKLTEPTEAQKNSWNQTISHSNLKSTDWWLSRVESLYSTRVYYTLDQLREWTAKSQSRLPKPQEKRPPFITKTDPENLVLKDEDWGPEIGS